VKPSPGEKESSISQQRGRLEVPARKNEDPERNLVMLRGDFEIMCGGFDGLAVVQPSVAQFFSDSSNL